MKSSKRARAAQMVMERRLPARAVVALWCAAMTLSGIGRADETIRYDAPPSPNRAKAQNVDTTTTDTTTASLTAEDQTERPASLAELLELDVDAIQDARAQEARQAAEAIAARDALNAAKAKRHSTPTTEETLERYEARLLADTRVNFGVTRDITIPTIAATPNAHEGKARADQLVKKSELTPPKALKRVENALSADEQEILRHIRAKTSKERVESSNSYGVHDASGTTTVSVMAEQYASQAAGAAPQTNVAIPAAVGSFNSNAYRNIATINIADVTDKAEPTLGLDDVEEFASQPENHVENADDGALEEDGSVVESNEYAEALAELEDECFGALDHYSSLFIAYEPTYDWTESVLQYVESILRTIEESPEESRALIAELRRKTRETDELKRKLEATDKLERAVRDPWNGDERPEISKRYTLAQRLELLEAFKNAIERRVFLWNHAANFFAAREHGLLHEPQDLTRQEMELLLKETEEVKRFFGDTANGKSWRNTFDVDALANELRQMLELAGNEAIQVAIARTANRNVKRPTVGYLGQYAVSSPADPYLDKMLEEDEDLADEFHKEFGRRMRFLHDRVNAIAYKIEKTPMTQEQRKVFNRPALTKWATTIAGFAADQTNGLGLLIAFERYERTAGGHSGRTLQQTALRMTTSQSETCRLFGRAIDVIYDNPNVKAYVSEALVNRLLPVRDPEFAVVQETILNNPVVGNRRVDTQVSIKLLPDPEKLRMTLNLSGRVHANTSSSVFSAKLYNESYATYVGQKTLEWRDTGLAYSPAVVNANATNRLGAVETDVDFLPIVGDLARGMTRSSYQSRQGEIEAESRMKIVNETRARFDKEANERFDAVNATLRNGFFKNMANLGLSLKTQRSKTTDDWLLASLRFGADYALGCQTTEPATLPGAFADLKIHESSVNSFLTQLDLADKTFTPRQALDHIADKLNKPALKELEIEESELAFTFEKNDPIAIRFFEDRAALVLRFKNMTLGAKSWDGIEVEVAYRPSVTPDGAPTFIRDGTIELYGPASVMEQIPIRTVFSKIFPAQKSFNLRADMLAKDERFAGLALGLCRISRGWFAVSVVKDPHFSHEIQKTYL